MSGIGIPDQFENRRTEDRSRSGKRRLDTVFLPTRSFSRDDSVSAFGELTIVPARQSPRMLVSASGIV